MASSGFEDSLLVFFSPLMPAFT